MRGPNLTDDERHQIVCILFESFINGKPKRGDISKVASKFQVDRRTILPIWKKVKTQIEGGLSINVKSIIPGKKGKTSIGCPIEAIKNVELSLRSSIFKLATAIGQHQTTVYKWIRKGLIKSHTSAINPDLTQDNKYLRLHFVVGKLYFDKLLHCVKFIDMSHIVHIDEKWFNMTKCTQRYYLAQGEDKPYRSCKSKRFITKVMFMAAVSRPTYQPNGDLLFDGKIGIFPFVFQEAAKQKSKNMAAGTMVTKPIESINKQVIRATLLNNVLPAIKRKWPASATRNIIIQQDNAKPHIKEDDPDFVQAATSNGFNIKLTQQPANSPNLNVLDLGFFRSIASLQFEKPAKTVEELVENVENAYANQKPEVLDDVWLSLQACMVEIMKKKKVTTTTHYPI